MTKSYDVPTGIAAIKAIYGEDVQIYNLSGKKVNNVRRGFPYQGRGQMYIINNKKVMMR